MFQCGSLPTPPSENTTQISTYFTGKSHLTSYSPSLVVGHSPQEHERFKVLCVVLSPKVKSRLFIPNFDFFLFSWKKGKEKQSPFSEKHDERIEVSWPKKSSQSSSVCPSVVAGALDEQLNEEKTLS